MLAAGGGGTILVWEERGMPLDQLAAYGAGIQVHVEDLAAYLAGRERCDADARWNELLPAYQDLAASTGQGLAAAGPRVSVPGSKLLARERDPRNSDRPGRRMDMTGNQPEDPEVRALPAFLAAQR